MTVFAQDHMLQALARIPCFEGLSDAALSRILAGTRQRQIPRGEVLIRQGDASDDLFLVLSGRFTVLSGDVPVAEIGAGEPIGELAFFSGGLRTATVIAARDSDVLVLTHADYDAVSRATPGLDRTILQSVSSRLARATPTTPRLRPRAGNLVAVVAADGHGLDPSFTESMVAALGLHRDWQTLRLSERGADPVGPWLNEQEASGRRTVILCDEAENAAAVARNSDTVFLVASPPRNPLSPLEAEILANTRPAHLHLALVRPGADTPIQDTAAWLADRPVALCHHVAADSAADLARLARFITGTALGVVLCGGGAFGAAHLGVIKAMQAQGIEIDMIGGTSVGAALGAALAVGYTPDEAMEHYDAIFIKGKAMKKLTAPLFSIVDQRPLDRGLQHSYRGTNIEDLPINFFTVATSLSRNDIHVGRHGPVWESVRGSSAIPAVFPAMVTSEGEVLIDGAMIDNVPIRVMRDLKEGPNLVLNFKQGKEWRVSGRYADLPGRLGALRRLLWRRRSDPRLPTITSILTRAMIVASQRQLAATPIDPDLLLEIAPLRGVGFLDWGNGWRLFQAAHDAMARALAQAGALTDDKAEQLRLAVAAMNDSQQGGAQ